jgi:hypothetical protein
MGDVMSRLPKLDYRSNPNMAGINTFYRGWFAYNVTGLIYIFTFMWCNSFGLRFFRQEGYKDWSLNLKNRIVIQLGLMLSTFLAYPFELAYKQQIMSIDQKGLNFVTMRQAINYCWKPEVKGGLYRGFWLCYIRNALFYMIFPYSAQAKTPKE